MSDAKPLSAEEETHFRCMGYDEWMATDSESAVTLTARLFATLDAERARADAAEAARDLAETSGVTNANYWKAQAEDAVARVGLWEERNLELRDQLDSSCNAEELQQVRSERDKAEAALERGINGEVPNRLKRWALDIRNAIPRIERETPRCDFAAGGVADGLHDQILLLLQAAQAIEKAEAALAEMKKQRNDALDLEERTENESRSVRAALAAAVAGHQTLIEGLESIASGKPNMAAIRGWCADEARRLRAESEREGR